jgi:hypothetical protein
MFLMTDADFGRGSVCANCGAPTDYDRIFCKKCGATKQKIANLVEPLPQSGIDATNGRSDRENRRQQAVDSLTRGWAILVAICTSPIYILFVYLGDSGRGRAAWVIAGMIALATRLVWDLKTRVWFWVTIAIITALHIPAILLIPWGDQNLSYVALLPLGLLDLGITYGIIRLVENAIEKSPSRGIPSTPSK